MATSKPGMPDGDQAMQQRIVSHMNSGHHDSLVRFLEYYSNVSFFAARDAQLTGMSLETVEVTSSGKRYVIPLSPPLKSWAEARERLVKMDRDATAGLGRSDITVSEYRAPKDLHAVIFGLCVLMFILCFKRSNLLPGSIIYDYVLRDYPGFAYQLYRVQPFLFPPVLAVHIAEASWMVKSRLAKYNVQPLSRLWWTWTVSTFLEGFGAFQRLDAIVREKKQAKEAQKTN